MVVIEEQGYLYSDSDSDDDDVDRYVLLARQPQPAPPGRRAEDDDRDASSENDDDDDDGSAGEEESGGGVRNTKKRPLREILKDDDAPPPTKKAQLEPIIASPLAAQTSPTCSESNLAAASSPRVGESGSVGSHEKAHEHRARKEEGEAKNATKKKRRACGKRSRSPISGEADGDRGDVVAAAKTAGASSGATATSGRFACSLCDRSFGSHQALGGHVLGHRKRTKIAIAAGAILDGDDAGEESTAVEVTEEAARSVARADKKDQVAARRGKANGDDGSSDEGKTVDDAAEHGDDEDVDRARHKNQRKGKGNSGVRKPMFAGSHEDANGNDGFDNKCNPMGVSGHGFTDGSSRRDSGKMDIGTASPNRKVVVVVAGTCHEGANGNGNVFRTRYKCKVCGTECITGRALGGHMRKHRKRPPVGGGGGGGEERSPSPATDDDCRIPLAQLFGAETSL